MRLPRYLKEDYIDLDLGAGLAFVDDDGEALSKRCYAERKEDVLRRLVDLLARSGRTVNDTKLLADMVKREGVHCTYTADGVVLPHVRTLQARDLAVAVGIAREGIPWTGPSGELGVVFCAMIAPPYDDRGYLQLCKRVVSAFTLKDTVDELLSATTKGEVIRLLSRVV